MKHYVLTKTEILGLSVVNPASAALVGWGVNLACAWGGMSADDKSRHLIGVTAFGAIIAGSVLMLGTWALFAIVLWQSKTPD